MNVICSLEQNGDTVFPTYSMQFVLQMRKTTAKASRSYPGQRTRNGKMEEGFLAGKRRSVWGEVNGGSFVFFRF